MIFVVVIFYYTLHIDISHNGLKRIINTLSPLFLIVYLTHGFVYIIVKIYLMPNLSESIIPYYLFFSVSVFSVLISSVINKTPFVRRLFIL